VAAAAAAGPTPADAPTSCPAHASPPATMVRSLELLHDPAPAAALPVFFFHFDTNFLPPPPVRDSTVSASMLMSRFTVDGALLKWRKLDFKATSESGSSYPKCQLQTLTKHG